MPREQKNHAPDEETKSFLWKGKTDPETRAQYVKTGQEKAWQASEANRETTLRNAKAEGEAALQEYLHSLDENEKSSVTIDKYRRDIRKFLSFCESLDFSKETVRKYKSWLLKRYRVTSVNSMLAATNNFLRFLGREDCRVRHLKTQNRIYSSLEEELTKEDFEKLLVAARQDRQMEMLLRTLGGTGIRISELEYFTVEDVKKGEIEVHCKNKIREILLPESLQIKLLDYAKEQNLESGMIFRTAAGKKLNRSNIWKKLKHLSLKAGVLPEKVFPHSFRKLFARTVYQEEKDIALLADLLGHSSLNTTRIYIKSTGKERKERMEKMHLMG